MDARKKEKNFKNQGKGDPFYNICFIEKLNWKSFNNDRYGKTEELYVYDLIQVSQNEQKSSRNRIRITKTNYNIYVYNIQAQRIRENWRYW